MRFKLDEHMPAEVVDLLTARGHDVTTVLGQGLGGSEDPAVAEVVREETRILATMDRGFGDVRAYPPEQFAGLIVFRLARQDPDHLVPIWRKLLPLLDRESVAGNLWIVEEGGVRRRGGESIRW